MSQPTNGPIGLGDIPFDAVEALQKFCPSITESIRKEDTVFLADFRSRDYDFSKLAAYTHERCRRQLKTLVELPYRWTIALCHNQGTSWGSWPESLILEARRFAFRAVEPSTDLTTLALIEKQICNTSLRLNVLLLWSWTFAHAPLLG